METKMRSLLILLIVLSGCNYCPNCGGSGRTEGTVRYQYGYGHHYFKECPECNGEGVIEK